jgi:hypothetical protein
MAKSEWQAMCCTTERDKDAVKSWFAPICDDMEPIACEVLSDIETDRSKKVRTIMVRKDGKRVLAVRTLGSKMFSIRLKPHIHHRTETYEARNRRNR